MKTSEKIVFETKCEYFDFNARIVEVRDTVEGHFRIDLQIDGPFGGQWAEGEGGRHPLTAMGYVAALNVIADGLGANADMIEENPDMFHDVVEAPDA